MTLHPWRCPACRGPLEASPDRLDCRSCARSFPLIGGIADLRVDQPHWIDIDEDRRRAEELLRLAESRPAADLVAKVFGDRESWTARDRERRARQILDGVARMERELDEWLRPPTAGPGVFLDLGCGAGQLLAAAARQGRHGIGVDVSLTWLVCARTLVLEAGGTPVLAAALAESLPLADASMAGVVSLDVIEHVGDQTGYLREIARVLAPGAPAALATPNRYSLTPEPHVGVWGVGWLPRRWQEPYATWRSGRPYRYCRLLSLWETRGMLHAQGLESDVRTGLIPPEELADSSRARAVAGRLFNRVVSLPVARRAVLPVCPFFQVLARKG